YLFFAAASYDIGFDEINSDSSPVRFPIRASPSHPVDGYGLSREGSAANKFSSDVDLQGPRALISAYGIDEREKDLYRKLHPSEHLGINGVDPGIPRQTWQNTEEEEFDWEDMTPGLADRRQSNDISSSLPHFGGSV
ncbi:hypothetical protein M569_04215, partial [Genlisea aurea]